jgi:hypothetical protein
VSNGAGASGFIVRNRVAFSRFMQQAARRNLIFGRRTAEENARNQTPTMMVLFAFVVFAWGIALVYIGITNAWAH